MPGSATVNDVTNGRAWAKAGISPASVNRISVCAPGSADDALRFGRQRRQIGADEEIGIERPASIGRGIIISRLLPAIRRELAGKHDDNGAIIIKSIAASPILQQPEKVFDAAAVAIGIAGGIIGIGRHNALQTGGVDGRALG